MKRFVPLVLMAVLGCVDVTSSSTPALAPSVVPDSSYWSAMAECVEAGDFQDTDQFLVAMQRSRERLKAAENPKLNEVFADIKTKRVEMSDALRTDLASRCRKLAGN